MTAPKTLARHADLNSLVAILRTNHARKLDVVAPASLIKADAGRLVLSGTDAILSDSGVTTADGIYLPTAICDDGLADKLSIPPGYLRRMRDNHLDLYDQNVNGWLEHETNASKNFFVRTFRSDDGGPGVARAFLSDHYKPIDDLDVLMTILDGLAEAGVECNIAACDLTDRRMYVQVVAEQIQAMAPDLLRGYRSPFTGQTGADNPIVFAGLEFSNSEVGHGRFSIAPRVVIRVCNNGMTMRDNAIQSQHLGGRLEPGAITWSDETQAKNLELIRSKTADAVRHFLDREWVQAQLDKLTQKAGVELAKPDEVIKVVTSKLRYSEEQQDDILRMFMKSGDLTAGGVMHAVTASAQNQTDADLAADMEGDALKVLDLAAANWNAGN